MRDKDGKAEETLKTKSMIIATGASPRILPGIEVDYEKVITSKEALTPKKLPKSMVVIGAGAIGAETVQVWLVQLLTVHQHRAAADPHVIARHGDHPFDQIRPAGERRAKDDHLPAPRSMK